MKEKKTGKQQLEDSDNLQDETNEMEDQQLRVDLMGPQDVTDTDDDKLKFGFSFSPGEGHSGAENEDKGDLPPDEATLGNRFDPSIEAATSTNAAAGTPDIMDLHIKGEDEIGMAYGPDNYIEEEEEEDGEEKDQ